MSHHAYIWLQASYGSALFDRADAFLRWQAAEATAAATGAAARVATAAEATAAATKAATTAATAAATAAATGAAAAATGASAGPGALELQPALAAAAATLVALVLCCSVAVACRRRVRQHAQKRCLCSALARLLRLLRARLAAPGGSRHPGRETWPLGRRGGVIRSGRIMPTVQATP